MQLIKLEKPGNKVWNQVNKVPCLVTKKKRKKRKERVGWWFRTVHTPDPWQPRHVARYSGKGASVGAGTLTPGPSMSTPHSGALYKFPGAAVTNDHKLGGLKNRNLFPHCSGSQKSEIKV